MVRTKIVPKEDMDIIRKYIPADEPGVILIAEEVLESLTEEQAAYVRKNDGEFANYGYGGEADAFVDFATTPGHYFFTGFLFPDGEED